MGAFSNISQLLCPENLGRWCWPFWVFKAFLGLFGPFGAFWGLLGVFLGSLWGLFGVFLGLYWAIWGLFPIFLIFCVLKIWHMAVLGHLWTFWGLFEVFLSFWDFGSLSSLFLSKKSSFMTFLYNDFLFAEDGSIIVIHSSVGKRLFLDSRVVLSKKYLFVVKNQK